MNTKLEVDPVLLQNGLSQMIWLDDHPAPEGSSVVIEAEVVKGAGVMFEDETAPVVVPVEEEGQKPLVIYHADCVDGFTAAWCAWHFFKGRADFQAAKYGDEPPDVTGRMVYVLDFSYHGDVLVKMAADALLLAVIDHHESALPHITSLQSSGHNSVTSFDMTKSGARLAWEHFFPDVPPPPLVLYVEDRDLWRHRLVSSEAVSAVIKGYQKKFELWDALDVTLRNRERAEKLIEGGIAILKYEDQMIRAICSKAGKAVIGGHKVLCANTMVLASEVGEKLAEGHLFGATWYADGNGDVVYSLRSREGGIKVNDVAAMYGGGGHPQAAGFRLKAGRTL